jgi:hypothetical protein
MPRIVRLGFPLMLLAMLAACGGHGTHTAIQRNPSRYYPPPGSPSDPWGPYIHEASGRFGIPELWIRRVMRQESGGQEDVISWAGAMGLMQVMPETYEGLRQRYGLGDDPFDPHNNILAGTAYLREMYDRFGAPGFLAAYNAGPNRLDRYLNSGVPLPEETVNYVAALAPRLGPGTPMSGPLAVYAGNGFAGTTPHLAGGCDPDAAYNPDGPCTPERQTAPGPIAAAAPATVASAPAGCDPDAAYDPTTPCRPAPPTVFADAPKAAAPPASEPRRPLQEVPPAAFLPLATPGGDWAIQVGAFASLATAEAAAENARMKAPDLLRRTKIELPATAPFGSQVAFRARLQGLTRSAAADACARLSRGGQTCITVPPGRTSF